MTFSLLSFPHKAGRGPPDQPKPLQLTFPLHLNSPFPSPKHKHVLLHASYTMSLATGLSSSSTASPPGPTGMVPPSAMLPHHRFLLSGLARPGRPCADGEGAATALPKGCFLSSAQCKGVRRRFLKQGPSPGARPGPPEQCTEPTLWLGSQAPFPSRGSPNLLPPPPSARRHFVRSRCDTDTIVGLVHTGKAQDPHALGSRVPAPCSPQGSRPTYAYPTNRRIPFAPHSLALRLQSRRRRSYRLQRAARMRVCRAFASPLRLPAPAYRRPRALPQTRETDPGNLVPEGGALACGTPGVPGKTPAPVSVPLPVLCLSNTVLSKS